jgi:hypothetical protein
MGLHTLRDLGINMKIILVNVKISVLNCELNISFQRQVSMAVPWGKSGNSLHLLEQGLSLPAE